MAQETCVPGDRGGRPCASCTPATLQLEQAWSPTPTSPPPGARVPTVTAALLLLHVTVPPAAVSLDAVLNGVLGRVLGGP